MRELFFIAMFVFTVGAGIVDFGKLGTAEITLRPLECQKVCTAKQHNSMD